VSNLWFVEALEEIDVRRDVCGVCMYCEAADETARMSPRLVKNADHLMFSPNYLCGSVLEFFRLSRVNTDSERT
jgi:hypothetical protein